MELASAACVDCCSGCATTAPACCTPSDCCDAACCEVNCQLLPTDTISYEYHEPEENFVSIDDAKIKSLLLKIGQQQQLELQRQQQEQHQQIIELLDDDEQPPLTMRSPPPLMIIGSARSLKPTERRSPDIQLIPKPAEPQHRIVARIELSDSECDNDDADDDELPLAAVSCELNDSSSSPQVIELPSDDDEQFQAEPVKAAPIKKRPPRPYVKRRGRHFYQCQACGKKVQSNYNLRRHMMIHTGERPFPCDLCDRRFREFSDLKKHRRRHINDPRYICMICQSQPPMEQDSTRCAECEGKNLLIKPQGGEDAGEGDPNINPTETEKAEEQAQEEDEDITPQLEVDFEQEIEGDSQARLTVVATSPPTHNLRSSPPPLLYVTLVPSLPTPKSSPATAKIAADESPPRPPVPRSCSSANSSSSLSNDTVVPPQLGLKFKYPCPVCHRAFGSRHNLKRHYMIHTGEKPFSCTKCRKPFREYSTLKKHMVTHVRQRWYKCLRCAAKFQDYLEYTNHKTTHATFELVMTESHHQQRRGGSDSDSSVEDGVKCYECHKRFTDVDTYTEHLKEHGVNLYGMVVDHDEDPDVDVA